jgi:hypothetical protein
MSGPVRWQDDDASPPEVRELLRSARGAGRTHALPAASRARSAARIDRMLALPAAAGLIVWLKGVAVAAGISAVAVVAGREVLGHWPGASAEPSVSPIATATAPKPVPIPRPKPTVLAAPGVPSVAASTTASMPSSSTHALPAFAPSLPPEPAPSGEADSLAREAAMLDHARALLASDPGAALAALDAQSAAFPSGHMGLERELLAVEALRRLQRVPEARARGESLLERARGSIYEARVRAILDSLPPP